MVTPEELTARSLRAYELGRVLNALRIALVVIPLAALCLIESRERSAVACVAAVLLGASVWLRWCDRRGSEAVTTGLAAGSLPLVAGLVVDRLGLHCGLAGADSFCTTFAVLLGAGTLISGNQLGAAPRASSVFTAAAVAALAAGLGCVRLGLVGLASMLAGIALGAFVGNWVRRTPPT